MIAKKSMKFHNRIIISSSSIGSCCNNNSIIIIADFVSKWCV